MDDPDVAQLSDEVQASFEPIMKALGAVRQQLASVEDVVTIRPGYKYPPKASRCPPSSWRSRPAPRRCKRPTSQNKFGVPFTRDRRHRRGAAGGRGQTSRSRSARPTDRPVSAFEKMLGGDGRARFRPAQDRQPTRSRIRPTSRWSRRRWS